MKLTQVVRYLEKSLKKAEKAAATYDQKASAIRRKIGEIHSIVGSKDLKFKGAKRSSGMSAAGRRKIALAQKKRWAAFRAKKKA